MIPTITITELTASRPSGFNRVTFRIGPVRNRKTIMIVAV